MFSSFTKKFENVFLQKFLTIDSFLTRFRLVSDSTSDSFYDVQIPLCFRLEIESIRWPWAYFTYFLPKVDLCISVCVYRYFFTFLEHKQHWYMFNTNICSLHQQISPKNLLMENKCWKTMINKWKLLFSFNNSKRDFLMWYVQEFFGIIMIIQYEKFICSNFNKNLIKYAAALSSKFDQIVKYTRY